MHCMCLIVFCFGTGSILQLMNASNTDLSSSWKSTYLKVHIPLKKTVSRALDSVFFGKLLLCCSVISMKNFLPVDDLNTVKFICIFKIKSVGH